LNKLIKEPLTEEKRVAVQKEEALYRVGKVFVGGKY